LTTNAKIVVTGDYKLYIDSIESDPLLSSSSYKKFHLNKGSFYDEVLPNFYNGLPVDISFKVKYDDDNSIMFNKFDKQFDDIYQMGCRNIIDNKDYNEEFECFAPLYLGHDSIPENFIVFRVDGPGLLSLDKDNFKTEIVNKLKCVSVFDLTKNTPLGEWIDKNFVNNTYFPSSPFYMDYRSLEFSSWNGIDYVDGGYASKSFFMDTSTEYENTFFDFEKLVYDGYKNNKLIFPNILNLSFLFDDTPATPDSLRKWSINRYLGFYVDSLNRVSSFNPYKLPQLRSDVVVKGGNILSSSNDNPFVDDWNLIASPFVEIAGSFYKVERYSRTYAADFHKVQLTNTVYSDEITPTEKYFYKIISDVDHIGCTLSSFNTSTIDFGNDINGYYMLKMDGTDLIPEYDSADVWIIKIDNKYHVINKIDGMYYLNSDYAFLLTTDTFQYWINSLDSSYTNTVSVKLDNLSKIISFDLFKCNFTEIKDFDTAIVDTKFSDFEYQKASELTATDETKLYTIDYASNVNPPNYNDYIINGRVVNIPCASEYTANGETFRIMYGDLSPIWRKNPIRVKWGYQNSLSSNDYPYLLNNSFISDDYNRTVNPFNPIPDRKERNLDYFYTINSSNVSYSYHSLHVESSDGVNIDTNFKFDLNAYLSNNYDYFTSFFGKKSSFDNGNIITNTEKWSTFEKGDNVIPNSTLFRGLKFDLYNVSDSKVVDGVIDSINLKSDNSYQGYKFSILLSKNDIKVFPSKSDMSLGITGSAINQMQWSIIDKWVHNKTYDIGSIVDYYDTLYICSTQSSIADPNNNPGNTAAWLPYTHSVILWCPVSIYGANSLIYNCGEYYYRNQLSTGNTFWNPSLSYDLNSVVLFQNKTWISTTHSNTEQPNNSSIWRDGVSSHDYWVPVVSNVDWSIVEMWSSLYTYYGGSYPNITKGNKVVELPGRPYVVYEDVVYQLNSSTSYSSGDIPSSSTSWNRVYSIVQDTNYVYSASRNPVISMNNRYYMCTSNVNSDTLDNGIVIYINKKFKNVLVNIYINDNTYNNISNADRDMMYSDIYSKLTTVNFTNSLGDISNKFGFSDYLQYVIVDDGITTYNFNNFSKIPCLLTYQPPDIFNSRNKSLVFTPSTIPSSQFKSKRQLLNGNISTEDMLNYYNGNSLGVVIETRKDDPVLVENISSLKNNIYSSLYRYSGNYSPIFYNIPLFQMGTYSFGNYKFDTDLTSFGMIKERVLSKVNRKGNILKFKSKPDIKSIYPMIDEFGYTFADYFMFKSTWDYEFFIECTDISQIEKLNVLSNKIIK